MEILINQISLKQALGQCTLIIYIKYGQSVKNLKITLNSGQKCIKYVPSYNVKFTNSELTKYVLIHFFIQTEKCNYHKVLGNKRVNLTNQFREQFIDIDLEGQNHLILQLKLKKVEPTDWQPQKKIEVCKQNFQSPRKFQTSPMNRSLDLKSKLGSPNLMQTTMKKRHVQYRSVSSQGDNLMRMDTKQDEEFPQQSLLFESDNSQTFFKELALLLDTTPDYSSILKCVQKLINENRQQSEQLIKIQCDNQLLQNQIQNLIIQQSLQHQSQQTFSQSIKQKLTIYEKLFEENVELKNQLKTDLQKIVSLNLELQSYKIGADEKNQINSQINALQQNLSQVCKEIDDKKRQNQQLSQEINQLRNFIDQSLDNPVSFEIQ